MPHTASASKRMRKSDKRRRQNRSAMKKIKETRKEAAAALGGTDAAATDTAVRAAQATVDRAATKGYIHKNKAARIKSRMAKRLKAKTAAAS